MRTVSRTASIDLRVIGATLLTLLVGISISPPASAQSVPPAGYTLTWDDEFNGPVGSLPSLQNWAPAIGNNFGWGNGDLENYGFDTAHAKIIADPAATDGLALQLTTTHDDSTYNVGDFTSVRLESIGKFNFQYGYLEFRAKAPVGGPGIWPALWTLGSDYPTVNWPDCGEQDIMEIFGEDMTTNYQSWHFNSNSWSTPYQLPGAPSFSDAYHTFGLLWTQQGVFSYVDGVLVASHQESDSPGYIFDHPNFLIMQTAVGGPSNGAYSVVGVPSASTPFPQNFDIDYVRFYSPPTSQVTSPGYGTVTDTCDNFGVAYSTSGGDLVIDNSNPQLFNGDAGRISRTFADTSWVDYKYQNISSGSVTVGTNTGDNTPVTLWYSTNGGSTYTQAPSSTSSITPTQAGWGYYTVSTNAGLPTGVTDLKVQMAPTVISWDHQLMSVTITNGSPAAAPPGPAELTATATNGGIVLNWLGSSDATSYDVYRSTSAYSEISAPPINAQPVFTGVTGTTFTDTAVDSGTTYNYMVAAADASGVSSQTPQASATAGDTSCSTSPSAPTGLAASSTTSNGTTLTWTPASTSCSVTGYTIYENGVAIGDTQTSTSWTGNAYVVSGLAPGTTYAFTVSATDGAGNSPLSTAISVTTSGSAGGGQCTASPSSPTGLTASNTTSTSTTLSWSAVTAPTNCSISTYAVSYNGTTLTTAGTSLTVTGLTPSTAYQFTVAATDANGTSLASTPIAVTTLASGASCTASPSAPTGLAASGTTSSGTTLSWSVVTPPTNCSISSYTVFQNGTSIGTTTGSSYTVSGLTASTTYSFTVAATDSNGTSVQSSAVSVTTASATCSASPSAPTGLAASGTTTSGTTLTWSAVTPPANCSITSYIVYQNGTSIGTATGTSYTVSGLAAATTYSFTVAATDSYGTSAQSSAVSVTTATPACSTSPSAPTGLAASGTTSTATTLTWTSVSPPTYCSISSYTVYQNGTAIATVSGTSYSVTGLSASTTYSFTVAATDANGTSPQSAAVSVTTTAAGGPIQIDCGGSATGSWVADTDYSGGTAITVTNTINLSGAPYPVPTQTLMQTERDGNITYTLPGFTPNSSHTVNLFFSENDYTANGQREFNVAIQGNTVLTNFDVYANTGAQYKAIEQSFSTTANSSGQIVVTFTSVVNNAEINGISVE